eukprot:TRINITY_DN3308_c1_g1_i2.p1 TRINITY_DN3308_c1_g1~~TRINITY_DN3308_c1_g1_i2.p1  ORF type:complete len:490 (+),score=37.76 TRINITY_DN3308_c1_g1_i2:131-1600(+)
MSHSDADVTHTKTLPGYLTYFFAWIAFIWWVVMLVVFPAEKGAGLAKNIPHIIGWIGFICMFALGILLPIPAPLGVGLVPFPLPDVIVQLMPDLAIFIFPIIWISFFLSGKWGVWACWSWYGFAIALFLIKRLLNKRSLEEASHTISRHRQRSLRAAVETTHRSLLAEFPALGGAPFIGLSILLRNSKPLIAQSVEVPVPGYSGGCRPSKSSIKVDIWTSNRAATKPVLLFIHGGAWVGGSQRRQPTVGFVRALALKGWVVACCSYRKTQWPLHLQDCAEALKWVWKNARQYGGDLNTGLFISGSSAGGQIAAVLTNTILADVETLPKDLAVINKKLSDVNLAGYVGWYPALDPKDDSEVGVGCPLPPITLSLSAWFFNCVVGSSEPGYWDTVQPVHHIHNCGVREFPPICIVHGTHDSVVPIAHSQWFYHHVRQTRTSKWDLFLPLKYVRHTYDLMGSPQREYAIAATITWLQEVYDSKKQPEGSLHV